MSTTDIIELAPAKLPARGSSEPFAEEAEWILREHEIVVYDDLESLDRKAAIGAELVRIQNELPNGDFRGWAERNLRGVSERTLRRYKAIFRRKDEPLAQSDPAAFLASIYGNSDAADDPAAGGADVNVRSQTGETKPPEKRTRKSRKVKTNTTPAATNTTPPSGDAPPPVPKPRAVGKVSLEIALANAAVALEKAVGDWKRIVDDWKKGSLAPLIEGAAEGNARIAAGLGLVGKDLDALVEMVEGDRNVLIERLRGFAREVAS
jgi:hypothetical protein